MSSPNHFTGLPMPVFTAFGWAGEETALNFALSQMELFIDALYSILPRDIQAQFPVHGLDKEGMGVYLAQNEQPETGLFIAFFARPMSFEVSLTLTDKTALSKTYKIIDPQPEVLHSRLTELGPGWDFRVQQMEFDEESQTATHYKDLFKDNVEKLDVEAAAAVVEKAAFLNSESKWVVPIYVSHRRGSEQVSAMGLSVATTMRDHIVELMPLVMLLSGQAGKVKAKPKPAAVPKPRPRTVVEETTIRVPADAAQLDSFIYVAELQPLHIRRGFINLTPNHWPFFAVSARTETRPVTIKYNDKKDEDSAVWRLVPTDQARIVLSSTVHDWLEDHFDEGDRIQITAVKEDDQGIKITLNQVD